MTDDNMPPIDPDDQKPARARSPVWVRILLTGSLALNLLIIGVVAGTLANRGGSERDGSPRLRDAGLGPVAAILSSDQRESLRGQLRQHAGDLRKNRELMREDVLKILAALRAEVFDAAAFAQTLEAQRSTMSGRIEIGHRALLEATTSATPEQRADMADRLEKALRRGGNRAKPNKN